MLLATYNGARFLREQIDSVLEQQGIAVHILARDDGSGDGTQEVLAEYASALPNRFEVLQDDVRTGTARGNFGLLLQAATGAYAAFCDQDDLWIPDKLAVSMARMLAMEEQHGVQTPLLVYTDLRVVDERLATVSESLWQSNSLAQAPRPTLAGLLSENVVTGCSALLNRALIDRMKTMPATAQMHDHWAALLASSLGAMTAVPRATVLYRQHASNVVGAVVGEKSLGQKIGRFVSEEGVAARRKQYRADRAQAQSLLELYGAEMTAERRAVVEGFLSMWDLPRIERLITTSRLGLWRPDKQRRIAQVIDLLRTK
ncbi:Glycosyl transferase family 2 [Terriglobus roseus]|uniref:Glycosyl transferase family 2 n=1 Tax=Terriglobus roseus TaxID=392734 RepID=A0A1H4RUR8_9BACT|nr:Glycosyl transferase family 2 [Terriglobus roseus]